DTQRHVHVLHRSVHGIFLSLKMAWGVCARAKPKVSPVSILSKLENDSLRPRPYSESKHHSISTHQRHTLCCWFWPGNISRRPFKPQLRIAEGVIRSASRLGFRFGQVNLNNHSSSGVRRLVAAMAPPSKGKRRQVAALHSALVICPSFARILTRTFNRTPILAL